MIVRESLAFNSQITFDTLSKLNSSFREFTNYLFKILGDKMGFSDAAGLLSSAEEEIRSLYDEGFTGKQILIALRELENESSVSESIKNVLAPKNLSVDEKISWLKSKLPELIEDRDMNLRSAKKQIHTPSDRVNREIAKMNAQRASSKIADLKREMRELRKSKKS